MSDTDTAAALSWQDPPPSARGQRSDKYEETADALRERSNTWALISGEGGYRHANGFSKSQRPNAFSDPAFEFTTRSRPDGRFDVYARYCTPDTAS